MTTSALERVIRRAGSRRVESRARCELCSLELLDDAHRHMLDSERSEVLCVCRACSVLFNREAASRGHYRLIPQRRLRLSGISPGDLNVPVGLAFFVAGADGSVMAHYPSPAGATRWDVDPAAWARVVAGCPALAEITADVEALLVNTAHGRTEAWLVPIDDCFRLVAVVRQEWKGLSGGDRVWPQIEKFFDGLRSSDGSHSGR